MGKALGAIDSTKPMLSEYMWQNMIRTNAFPNPQKCSHMKGVNVLYSDFHAKYKANLPEYRDVYGWWDNPWSLLD